MIKGTPKLIKQMNKSTILSIIIKKNEISRVGLSKETKLSKSTVSFIVDELINENLIKETKEGNSTKRGGRKPIHLEFNPTAGYIVGLEIGIRNSLCALSDLSGNIILEKKIEININKKEVINHIIEKIKEFISGFKEYKNIIGIGISIPGITDIEKGRVLYAPELNLMDFGISELFEEKLNMNVFIDNDVNMAVLGEKWFGAGNEYSDFVFVTIGTGIGSGIVINRKIYRGSNYCAGEIGYLALSKEALKNKKYSFDQFGYFESVASPAAIEKVTKKSLIEVFEKANQGNSKYIKIIEDMTDYLSLGIANVISILNPEALIIGGSIFSAKKQLLNPIKEKVSKLTPVSCIIKISDLDSRSGIMGCMASVLTNTYGVELY